MNPKTFVAIAFACALSLTVGCDDGDKKNPAANDMTVKVAPPDLGNAPQAASQAPPTTGPAASATASTPTLVPAPTPTPAPAGAGERQSAGGVSWELPAGWSKAPDAPMRLATITDGQAEVAISSFPGDVGGTLANVVRWQNQVGMPPATSEAEAEKLMTEVDVAGAKIRTLDLSGSNRMLVAIVPAEGRLYFFKMTGTSEIIAARKKAFDALVKSIRLG